MVNFTEFLLKKKKKNLNESSICSSFQSSPGLQTCSGQVFIDSSCSNMPLLSLRYLQFQWCIYVSKYVCMYVCICLIDFLEIKKNNFRFTKESQNYTEFLYTTPLVFSNVYLLHKHRIVMKTKKLILVWLTNKQLIQILWFFPPLILLCLYCGILHYT